jgi:hypothetical protein
MFDYRILEDRKLVVNATCVRLFCTWQNVFHSMHGAVDATATPSIFTASTTPQLRGHHPLSGSPQPSRSDCSTTLLSNRLCHPVAPLKNKGSVAMLVQNSNERAVKEDKFGRFGSSLQPLDLFFFEFYGLEYMYETWVAQEGQSHIINVHMHVSASLA